MQQPWQFLAKHKAHYKQIQSEYDTVESHSLVFSTSTPVKYLQDAHNICTPVPLQACCLV